MDDDLDLMKRRGGSMNLTAIGWCDFTWGVASGCIEVSEECKFCYARELAEKRRGTNAFPNGFDLTIRPHKLAEPRREKEPAVVFVGSMTDIGLAELGDDYRDMVWSAQEEAPWHRYLWLSKRPEEVARYIRQRHGGRVPEFLWVGTTIGLERTAWRAEALATIDAPVRFLSAEPLLGALRGLDLAPFSWMIVGGESGEHAGDVEHPEYLERRFLVEPVGRRWAPRQDRADWVRALRDECAARQIAFFFKQWGGPVPASAGRELDGRTHDELPTAALPVGYKPRKKGKKVHLAVVS